MYNALSGDSFKYYLASNYTSSKDVISLCPNKLKSLSLLLEHIFMRVSEHSFYPKMTKQLSGVSVYSLVIYIPSINKIGNGYYYDSNY